MDIECENISVWTDIGGGGGEVDMIDQIWGTENVFVLAYPNC